MKQSFNQISTVGICTRKIKRKKVCRKGKKCEAIEEPTSPDDVYSGDMAQDDRSLSFMSNEDFS